MNEKIRKYCYRSVIKLLHNKHLSESERVLILISEYEVLVLVCIYSAQFPIFKTFSSFTVAANNYSVLFNLIHSSSRQNFLLSFIHTPGPYRSFQYLQTRPSRIQLQVYQKIRMQNNPGKVQTLSKNIREYLTETSASWSHQMGK